MTIFNMYELAMEVPDNWTDFDNNRDHYKELLCLRFNEKAIEAKFKNL